MAHFQQSHLDAARKRLSLRYGRWEARDEEDLATQLAERETKAVSIEQRKAKP